MAYPYKRVLCPVDFDGHSLFAIEEAKAIAAGGAAVIFLLHAVRISPLGTEGFVTGEFYDSQVKFAREHLDRIAAEKLAGVEHQLLVEIGEPADVILMAERKLQADLIVMATHGRRGLTRLVLGSTAERIVRESTVPVLTVRPLPAAES
ncbi:MAG: universal stress protein [Candidatus Binataceae bacterium]